MPGRRQEVVDGGLADVKFPSHGIVTDVDFAAVADACLSSCMMVSTSRTAPWLVRWSLLDRKGIAVRCRYFPRPPPQYGVFVSRLHDLHISSLDGIRRKY